jgi:hypothetical protein
MTLPPDKWVEGMTLVSKGSEGRIVLLKKKGSYWDVDISEAPPLFSGTYLTSTLASLWRVGCYSDLNRDPVEGERAVKVALRGVEGEYKLGAVVTMGNDGNPDWMRDFGHLLAPLSPAEPEREPSMEVTWVYERVITEEEMKTGGTIPGNLLEPTHVKCNCHRAYLRNPRLADPCQPCAAIIDCADYWMAWYADNADRCPHGWKSCPSLWNEPQACPHGGE